jgi:glyoxylase-like metal-dependent hydrolase (beta-lactamase superfamily II)
VSRSVEVLNLGDVPADWSFTVFGRPPGTGVVGPAQAFLLLGGERPLLVDAGIRNREVLARLGMDPPWASDEPGFLEDELARFGLEVGDIAAVIQTHLHVDHAGRLDAFPMSTPVIVNRAELAFAFSGLQGPFYAPEDLAHVLQRMYTPGALGILDLALGETAPLFPGVRALGLGGHTPGSIGVLVDTDEGVACLCGDVVYEVAGALLDPPFPLHWSEPALSGNHATSMIEEKTALKRALGAGRFLYPSHDPYGAVIEHGRVIGRVGPHLPGPLLPFDAAPSLLAADRL